MYNTIQITERNKNIFDDFSINIFSESSNNNYEIFTEAVFENGKKKMQPIVDSFKDIHELLLSEIENNKDKFNPEAFWRHKLVKDLEDKIQKIFGFRSVQVHPYIEKYRSKTDDFESAMMNCITYPTNRFPIEGLVTDDGFYDKSRSCVIEIYITLGVIKKLTPEEITGVFLHELGHSIDPAIIDIRYAEVNILSKYLTDRKNAINKCEKTLIKDKDSTFIIRMAKLLKMNSSTFLSTIKSIVNDDKKLDTFKSKKMSFNFFGDLFISKNKREQKKLDEIKRLIDNDKEEFNRQNYSEAFADNFARMYGFGVYLASGLKKMTFTMDKPWLSRFKKEKRRQEAIISLTKDALKDEHKTDIHRIHALIKEYNNDLKDPNISKEVKEDIKEDIEELKKVLNEYLNHFDSFQAKVYKLIDEELTKMEGVSNINESVEYFEEKSHGKLKYDFRRAVDFNTGHALKIVYSLDNIKINDIGSGYIYNHPEETRSDIISDIQKNITRKGNNDHESSGQKVLAIIDRYTNEQLKEVDAIGPHSPGINVHALIQDDDFMDEFRKSFRKDPSYMKKYVHHLKVGEIDTSSAFKSTHWFSNDKKGDKDNSNLRGQAAESLKYGRGVKLNNLEDQYFIGAPAKYKNPSKRDIRRNPELYREHLSDEEFEKLMKNKTPEEVNQEINDVKEDFEKVNNSDDIEPEKKNQYSQI